MTKREEEEREDPPFKPENRLTQTVTYSPEQQLAIDLCCDLGQTIVGVTGGAGVGKTLVLGRVHSELKKRGRAIALCAPTGRAAKRIEELTGIKAKTIHRLLEFPIPEEFTEGEEVDPNMPRRNQGNPLNERVVIVDEASMLSPTLFQHLLNALPRSGVIRFFGDNNQLPPIEEGRPPFIALLKEKPSVELTYNFRSGDLLVANAQRVLRGMLPQRNEKFEIIYTEEPLRTMVNFVGGSKEFLEDTHQIIMPTRKGKAGTMMVNPSLQMKLNGKGPYLRLARYDEKEALLSVRAGDKFIWIKNDYKLAMFNGEIGKVDWIDEDSGELGLVSGSREIHVPSRVKMYSPYHGHIIDYDPRRQIELGYAVTTHKAQGSEFDTVVYCISSRAAFLLNRRNFYTAITRAKNQVIMICDRKSMGLSTRRYEV